MTGNLQSLNWCSDPARHYIKPFTGNTRRVVVRPTFGRSYIKLQLEVKNPHVPGDFRPEGWTPTSWVDATTFSLERLPDSTERTLLIDTFDGMMVKPVGKSEQPIKFTGREAWMPVKFNSRSADVLALVVQVEHTYKPGNDGKPGEPRLGWMLAAQG